MSIAAADAESTDVTSDIAEELLRAADQYMLDGLKPLCEESISQGLPMDNLTETYDLAENFNAPQLGRRCALFALEHYTVRSLPNIWLCCTHIMAAHSIACCFAPWLLRSLTCMWWQQCVFNIV